MQKQEVNQMTAEQLKAQAGELRKELFLLRMKKFSAPEKNTALSKVLRKSLARTLTVLRQRELHGNQR